MICYFVPPKVVLPPWEVDEVLLLVELLISVEFELADELVVLLLPSGVVELLVSAAGSVVAAESGSAASVGGPLASTIV